MHRHVVVEDVDRVSERNEISEEDEYDDEDEEKMYHWRSQDYATQDAMDLFRRSFDLPGGQSSAFAKQSLML